MYYGSICFGNCERQNIHVYAALCDLALKESPDEERGLTTDENYYRITGHNCRQWFYQSGSCSCLVNFNVEITIEGFNKYAVEIEGNKFVHLTGEIRGSKNSAIRIAGGNNLTVLLDIGIINTSSGLALKAESGNNITGTLVSSNTSAGGVYLGNISQGSILNVNIKHNVGGSGLQLGIENDQSQKFRGGIINYICYATNDNSLTLNAANAENTQVILGNCNKGISISTVSNFSLNLTTDFIRSALEIATTAANLTINIAGVINSSTLNSYPYPIAGMRVLTVGNRGFTYAVYDGISWQYGVVAP